MEAGASHAGGLGKQSEGGNYLGLILKISEQRTLAMHSEYSRLQC